MTRTTSRSRLILMGALIALVLSTCAPPGGLLLAGSDGEGSGSLQITSEAIAPGSFADLQQVNPPPLPTARAHAQGEPAPPAGNAPGKPLPSPQPQLERSDLPAFEPVVVQQPRIRIDGLPTDGRDHVAAILAEPGVQFATAMLVAQVPIAAAGGPAEVSVAAVDPQAFRVLTPQVTADAVAVWQRLVEGDAAFTHDVGHRLALELGSRVPTAGEQTVRVGAYASNGIPPVADAIVSSQTAQRLGLEGTLSVLVSVAPDSDPYDVAARLEAIADGQVAVIQDPQPRRAFLTGADARNAFEPFTYIDYGDGMIEIDPDWVRRNIVAAQVPIFTGHVVCHRLLIDQLRGALQDIVDAGLAHLIDPTDYGGCWVPRHIDFNPAKPLSMHAWGLAVDINVSTNGLGAVPQMDPQIVEIFDRWGFVWGGRWRRPDGMHFELGALLHSPQG